MDRKDKINLLKGIQSGVISIDILKPKIFQITINTDSPEKAIFFIDNKRVDQATYGKYISNLDIQKDEVIVIINGKPSGNELEYKKRVEESI